MIISIKPKSNSYTADIIHLNTDHIRLAYKINADDDGVHVEFSNGGVAYFVGIEVDDILPTDKTVVSNVVGFEIDDTGTKE